MTLLLSWLQWRVLIPGTKNRPGGYRPPRPSGREPVPAVRCPRTKSPSNIFSNSHRYLFAAAGSIVGPPASRPAGGRRQRSHADHCFHQAVLVILIRSLQIEADRKAPASPFQYEARSTPIIFEVEIEQAVDADDVLVHNSRSSQDSKQLPRLSKYTAITLDSTHYVAAQKDPEKDLWRKSTVRQADRRLAHSSTDPFGKIWMSREVFTNLESNGGELLLHPPRHTPLRTPLNGSHRQSRTKVRLGAQRKIELRKIKLVELYLVAAPLVFPRDSLAPQPDPK